MEIERVNTFQSLTGSTGHLAHESEFDRIVFIVVSIPNGLHRPFSLSSAKLEDGNIEVSIPNGLHRPFSQREKGWHQTTSTRFNP